MGASTDVLDLPPLSQPDPDELVKAAMAWHFSPETGSPFWVRRAATLGFDPLVDIKSFDDLREFPNVTDELRNVDIRDLIPRGFGPHPEVVSVIESGGTTGEPKRIPLLREYADRMAAHEGRLFERWCGGKGGNWLSTYPSGPHGALEQMRRAVRELGGIAFAIDIDPRWVKKLIASGRGDQAREYTEHIVAQAAEILRTQKIDVLRCTAPILVKLAEQPDLVEIIRANVRQIIWGGASMDADTRYLLRSEIFPDTRLDSTYGTTMALGAGGATREGLRPEDPCIYDPTMSPYTTYVVVDPATGERVPFGERGQVVYHHVSKSFFLPNNGERDMATRIEPLGGQVGDSVADVAPLTSFGGATVIEGVY